MLAIIKNVLLAVFIFVLGYFFGFKEVRFYRITSSSMEPTLQIGDRIATLKPEHLTRRTIVVLRDPKGSDDILTKRIIGLPGEALLVKNRVVYIDGKRIAEPYVMEPPDYQLAKVRIPSAHYMIFGDNRNESEDSSEWGPVATPLIVGKAFFRYWPLNKFGFFLRVP